MKVSSKISSATDRSNINQTPLSKWVEFNFKLINTLCSVGIGLAVLFLIFTLFG